MWTLGQTFCSSPKRAPLCSHLIAEHESRAMRNPLPSGGTTRKCTRRIRHAKLLAAFSLSYCIVHTLDVEIPPGSSPPMPGPTLVWSTSGDASKPLFRLTRAIGVHDASPIGHTRPLPLVHFSTRFKADPYDYRGLASISPQTTALR